jgi:hypothetical protein
VIVAGAATKRFTKYITGKMCMFYKVKEGMIKLLTPPPSPYIQATCEIVCIDLNALIIPFAIRGGKLPFMTP